MTTARTFAGGAFPTVNLDDGLAAFGRNVPQDTHEVAKGQIAHFTTPQRFHTRDIEVFKTQHIIVVAQLVRQLKVGITALVGNADMRPANELGGFLTVVRAVRLFIFARLQQPQSAQRVAMMQPGAIGLSGVVGEESFQPEVQARDFTRRDLLRNDTLLNHTENQPQSVGSIPFNSERFNIAVHGAMFHKFVDMTADLDFVPVQPLPSRLFERERLALAHLLILGRTFGKALEKALVGAIQSFQYILHRLRTEHLPKSIALGTHPQMGDMGLQFTECKVLPGQAVVAFLQRQGVIPDRARDVDLLMQIRVAFVAAVESVLVGTANFDRMRLHSLTAFLSEGWWGRPSRDQHPHSIQLPFYLQFTVSLHIPTRKRGGFTALFDKNKPPNKPLLEDIAYRLPLR
jgi:hypothetical protein